MFFNISISLCLNINQKLLIIIFKSLDYFMTHIFVLITFEAILDGFVLCFGQIQMADQDGRRSEIVMQLLRHVK